MGRRATSDPSTRERILAAADELFGELGYDATATRLIAERCGVNKALIHYHFSSKQALFAAVLDRYYERLGRALTTVLTGPGSPRERLFAIVDGYVDFLAANRNFPRLVQREAVGGPHLDQLLFHMVPLFRAGEAAMHAAYPMTREGPLAARDLLLSFYGMIVSTFTYGPVIGGLMGTDPLSPASLERRKEHLRRMAEMIFDAVE